MYDTIIIGAGMSGLAAGIRLAHYGKRVCILEKHYTIGGLNSFYRLRGRDYDVGLHAVTNYAPKGSKKGPLIRLLRQLRLRWEDLDLSEQYGSRIAFPGVHLSFNNDLGLLESEIAAKFPRQKDNFQKLLQTIVDYDDLDERTFNLSTRQILGEIFDDPLLIEMLLCPVMWYGNAREHDMDFAQFSIMFRSIFVEGLARPFAGVRLILKHLVRKYRSLGGELRLRSGVARICVEGDRATGVVLENGDELEARNVLSSAGLVETMQLCDNATPDWSNVGRMSFAECISILDKRPRQLGINDTIVFYNDSDKFHWESPHEALCDVRTGVICSPNNFQYSPSQGDLPDGVVRITAIASFDGWTGLSEENYRLEKLRWYDRIIASAVRFIPDFRSRVIDTDMFTPRTIHRYTWHANAAVYGAPRKQFDGKTHLQNLFICGSDQGLVGIVGSIVSGISIANKNLLLDD